MLEIRQMLSDRSPIFHFSILCIILLVNKCSSIINPMKYPPLMVKQPPTDELLFQVAFGQAENDKPFVIECEAEGEPAPRYTWEKNGKPFDWQIYDERIAQQPGRGTLVITSPRTEDIGQYKCFATNELGVATSNSVFVRMSELNNFKHEDPITMTIQEGEPAQLKCRPPDGYPPPEVHWILQHDSGSIDSINSTRMTVDPEGTLWFSNVTRGDRSRDFTYACSATSAFRNEYKLGSKVYLKVQERGASAFEIKNEPKRQFLSRKNTVILKGRELKLYCIFSGTPLPIIKWGKEGGFIPQDRSTFEDYGKTLVIKYIDLDDAGTYECEATNGVGRAKSYTMQVKVQALPYFTVEPEIQNKAEGEVAEFHCGASGKPEPKIRWIYNGRPIEQAVAKPNREVAKNTVRIFNLTKRDTGNYGCNASNEHGYVYKDVYVNVLALPPEIKVPPSNVQTVEGQNVNMTCRVFGAPKPRITWIRDQMELTGGRYNITSVGDLVIEKVTFMDEGDYTCVAVNRFGRQSVNGSLEVKKRTQITDAPQDYEVAAGMTATFRCNAVADESLHLSIDWLIDNKKINFHQEPRFVKQTDNSLSITKTTELDSAIYTCVASTDLDSTMKLANLIVQDVPNAPNLKEVECQDKGASITWEPNGDNRAPILAYTIQHNTSFTPDTWEDSFSDYPASSTQANVNMSPWANYTFRVIARNKIGVSLPSGHSKVCTTPEEVPHKNPDGVQGKGSTPSNLVIKWSPMPEIEHNGPGFKYRLYYKRADIADAQWITDDVVDWERDQYIVPRQPTFKPYKIRVEAHNDKGVAQVAAPEVIGYSGEDVPLESPSNLTLLEIKDSSTAWLSWRPVSNASIRGHFVGYKIQTWLESEDSSRARTIIVENNNEPSAVIDSFVPNVKNYARVLVFNGAEDGPPSEIVELDMPEGVPGPIDYLEAIPLGSSAFMLMWKKPKSPNGILTGYHIFYQEVQGTNLLAKAEREPPIYDPDTTKAKLGQLRPGTKFRLIVRARTKAGIGAPLFIERTTRANGEKPPGKPSFIWEHMSTERNLPALKITWIPDFDNPGSYFFVQYKRYREPMFEESRKELNENFLVITGLNPGLTYEVRVVTIDGYYNTPSDTEEIYIPLTGMFNSGVSRVPFDSFATRTWFIGMMVAIAILLLCCIIVCIVKRNRGGKYVVHEREAARGRADLNNEDGGFPEYSQPLDGNKRDSLASDMKPPLDSDIDSLAEFAEGDTAGMAEDGSFIGQYGRKRGETESTQAFATLV